MQNHMKSPFLSDEDFDMWHDYMGLSRLMKRLCSWPGEEEEEKDKEEEATVKDQGRLGVWKGLQITPSQVKSRSSPETTSAISSSISISPGSSTSSSISISPGSSTSSSTNSSISISPGSSFRSSFSISTTSSTTSSTDYCRFCKQNGESPGVYRSHILKSDNGKVTCPILRNYTCPICEATGDEAHTRRYCPQLQRQEAERLRRMPTKF